MSVNSTNPENSNPVVSLSRYSHLLELMVSGHSLHTLLEELCYLIQERQPGCIASVLLLSEDGLRLTHGAAPSLPQAYIDGINGVEIGHGVGSCGTAAFNKELVIVEDIDNHPFWGPYKELAAIGNLKACWSQPIFGANNQVLGTFAMYYNEPRKPSVNDIVLILEASRLARFGIEHSRAQTQGKLSTLIAQNLPMGMITTDENFLISGVNPAFTQITGFSAKDVIGKRPQALVNTPGQLEQFKEIIAKLPPSRSWTSEIQGKRKNQETFTAEICFSAIHDQHGKMIKSVALISDISERKRSEETIHYLANYDVLTNLPNRNLFYEHMTWAIEKGSHNNALTFSVVILDLDYFKEVNDNHGHDAGDELLIQAANRLKNCLDEGDTIARLGGDEFGIIISDADNTEKLANISQRCLSQLSKPFKLRQVKECRISGSLGIARFPEDGATIAQLMKAADQALYAAKAAGRNTCKHFTQAMQQEAVNQALMHQDLRHAVERNELELHYQPIMDINSDTDTATITQLEALVRWNHPERGLVRPDIFIPLAEKTGIIREIGDWVRSAALQQIKHFEQQGLNLCIAVNLSTAEFFDNNLADHILEQVQQAGVHPSKLTIEITESLFIQNQADTRDFLQRLKNNQIKIALDDFGTGFSSLSYLSAFPVDKLKIDKSFIDDMTRDSRKQALVDSIINLGHSLDMQVIAEGIEEQEQLAELKNKGCDSIQGYYLSRPLGALAIEHFVLEHQAKINSSSDT
ncbi:EAL domain-containing protein [Bacterioplanoides sp.]|uniref:sensor domain-containing phosphodiesterase n=1 Tax=Bacterioplanoides sp. TaxID=2066072 RepID=UPI003B007E68